MMIRAGLVVCALFAAPAYAEPLTFGAINGTDDLSRNTEIARCAPGRDSCALTRTTFGGLPIARSQVALNPSGRVRTAEIVLDARHHDLAYQLLAGRYGTPTATQGYPRWTRFDDDARVAIRRAGGDTLISFDYPANAPASTGGAGLPWPVLLFAGLGLAAGFGAYRVLGRRRARPALAAAGAPLSMKATLEGRLRRGEELSF